MDTKLVLTTWVASYLVAGASALAVPLPRFEVTDVAQVLQTPDKVADLRLLPGLVSGNRVLIDRNEIAQVQTDLAAKSSHPEVKYTIFDYKDWYVTALRFDSCAQAFTPELCRKEVRLVVQPLVAKVDRIISYNSALHLVYNLTEDEFTQAVTGLVRLKKSYGNLGQRLDPTAEGHADPGYLKALQNFIFDNCQHKSLARIGVMLDGLSPGDPEDTSIRAHVR